MKSAAPSSSSHRTPPRAVLAEALGPLENYRLAERDPGPPGPQEVRYRIKAAAVNFVDVLVAMGKYQVKPPLPFVPGAECAGVVECVGAEVSGIAAGDAIFTSGVGGAFCEAAIAPASQVFAYPSTLSVLEAATFKVSYTTAYHALVQRAALRAGETMLVLGASGGVGCAAVQLGRALGARVIASASSEAKRRFAVEAGAHAIVDARAPTWREDVRAANDGKPIDVVVDPVGGAATEPAFRTLAWGGRHLVIGFAAGEIPKLPTNLPLLKGASLIGVDIRQFVLFEPAAAAANIQALFELHAVHGIRPLVTQQFPLERFADAMRAAAAARDTPGRIVLTMD